MDAKPLYNALCRSGNFVKLYLQVPNEDRLESVCSFVAELILSEEESVRNKAGRLSAEVFSNLRSGNPKTWPLPSAATLTCVFDRDARRFSMALADGTVHYRTLVKLLGAHHLLGDVELGR